MQTCSCSGNHYGILIQLMPSCGWKLVHSRWILSLSFNLSLLRMFCFWFNVIIYTSLFLCKERWTHSLRPSLRWWCACIIAGLWTLLPSWSPQLRATLPLIISLSPLSVLQASLILLANLNICVYYLLLILLRFSPHAEGKGSQINHGHRMEVLIK